MIRLDVQQYCQACLDFEPDVVKPIRVYSDDHTVSQTDTVIRCKNHKRCENIKRYLEQQFKSKENAE